MDYKFTLILNAGRSGSKFLFKVLKQNFGKDCYISHEEIPVEISKPRVYNRQYKQQELEALRKDATLMGYIENWQSELKQRHVIETGWTVYHLAPLLNSIFKEKFQIIILHRDPISFAFSRTNMGNYHQNTFYTNYHEVNPYDPNSIAPDYQDKWSNMNPFEKCMYWWYIVYKEAFEFKLKNSEVPCLVIKSTELFNFYRFDDILEFLDLDSDKELTKNVSKNELAQFMRETFPVNNEWLKYKLHPEILNFANDLGYQFNDEDIANLSKKYKLPSGLLPLIRHKTNYWKIKSKLRSSLKFN